MWHYTTMNINKGRKCRQQSSTAITHILASLLTGHGSKHGREYLLILPHFTRPLLCVAYTTYKASRQRHPASLLTRLTAYKASISVLIAKLLMTSPYASHATSHGISLRVMLLPQSRLTGHPGSVSNKCVHLQACVFAWKPSAQIL